MRINKNMWIKLNKFFSLIICWSRTDSSNRVHAVTLPDRSVAPLFNPPH